jgi:hypothetical protein
MIGEYLTGEDGDLIWDAICTWGTEEFHENLGEHNSSPSDSNMRHPE